MSTKKISIFLIIIGAAIVSGCHQNQAPSSSAAPDTQASASATEHKAGVQLWSENCSRCHNIRPPQSYSDAQWEAVVHHMRLRADLTGEEARKITEFLQASR